MPRAVALAAPSVAASAGRVPRPSPSPREPLPATCPAPQAAALLQLPAAMTTGDLEKWRLTDDQDIERCNDVTL